MALRFSAAGQDRTRTVSLGNQTQWSMSCWINVRVNRAEFTTAWSLDDGSTDFDNSQAAFLSVDAGLTATFQMFRSVGGTTQSIDKGARVLAAGTWYYVAVSVNGANGTMLTRGQSDTSPTVTTWSDGPAAGITQTHLRLGKDVFGEGWPNGALAAVKWWGAALTRDELEVEAWTHTPRRTTGLRAWYPLTQAEHTDYSGNEQTLSGAGGATEDGPPIAWRPARRRIIVPLSVDAAATPGLITGVASIPAPAVSTGVTIHPGPILGIASIPTPDVFVGSSPPTNVQPGLITGVASIPAPTVATVKNVSITPGTILARAVIPSPTVTTPVAAGDDLERRGQISYNGFRMGSGTPYSLQLLTGWWVDMPPLDNGDVPHPSEHGAMPGQKLSQARIVTADYLIKAPKDEIEQAALDFLAGLPVPDADEQLPLAVRVLDRILIGYGACTARAAPIDKRTPLGHIRATAQWTLANPRLYSRELASATLIDGAEVDVFNFGNTTTHPLIRCPGPANGPELVVERILPDGSTDLRVLEFDLEIALGENLIIDPQSGTVRIGDVSKMRSRTGASVGVPDFVLGPGISELSYSTAEGGAPPATALWRHAHL